MFFCTDWFLADEREARAVASIATTEDHAWDDWPHQSLKNAGAAQLLR